MLTRRGPISPHLDEAALGLLCSCLPSGRLRCRRARRSAVVRLRRCQIYQGDVECGGIRSSDQGCQLRATCCAGVGLQSRCNTPPSTSPPRGHASSQSGVATAWKKLPCTDTFPGAEGLQHTVREAEAAPAGCPAGGGRGRYRAPAARAPPPAGPRRAPGEAPPRPPPRPPGARTAARQAGVDTVPGAQTAATRLAPGAAHLGGRLWRRLSSSLVAAAVAGWRVVVPAHPPWGSLGRRAALLPRLGL